MLPWFAVLLAALLLAMIVVRTPSMFLFELIEGCFSAGVPRLER